MNVLVMSPHAHHTGNTTFAGLLAMELAARGQKSCLTHLNTRDESLIHYFGVDRDAVDSTNAPSKLSKMLKEKIIAAKDAPNYCRNISKDCDLLTVADRRLDEEYLKTLVWFEATSFPFDVVVYDVDVDLETFETNEAVKLAIERADFIIWIFSQGILEVRDFKAITPKLSKLLVKPSCGIINRFDKQVSSIKDVQSEISSKEMSKDNSWLRFRYNPIITKYTNGGSLQYLHAAMKNGDYAVVDIANDITQVANRVMKFGRKLKSQLAKNKSEARTKELDKYKASAQQQQADSTGANNDSAEPGTEVTDKE